MTDIRMPPTHTTEGLDAARVIRDEFPDIGILVLSAHVEVEHAMELLASGHSIGYLLKSRVTDVADFVDTLSGSPMGRRSSIPRWCGAGVGAAARRSVGGTQRARARGVGLDGRGAFQCRYRPSALGHRGHGGKARAQHFDQAESAGEPAMITGGC